MFEHPTELTLVHDTPESYLLDACVAISAYQEHFPFVQFPEIWDDLLREAKLGRVAIPPQIMSEIEPNENEFTEWLKQKKARDILQLGEAIDQSVVDRVIRDGYAKDLTVPEHIKLGRDPVLIAYACVQPGRRVVVTDESRSRKICHLKIRRSVRIERFQMFAEHLVFRGFRGLSTSKPYWVTRYPVTEKSSNLRYSNWSVAYQMSSGAKLS